MKLSEFSIKIISEYIAGNPEGWPYRTGPQLIEFFNKMGFKDVYEQGFPSRVIFAKNKIDELNSTQKLKDVIREMLDPRLWLNTNSQKLLPVEVCAEQINKILKFDEYEVVRNGNFYKVRELSEAVIEIENRFEDSNELNELVIEEHIQKCREKIESGDYSGAITNARSLIESVCRKIEFELDNGNAQSNDGDLIKLFNRVKKLLQLDPSRQDISESLKQVITGLSSIINGLAAIRNKMSDAHGSSYKPNRHHAKLAVNSAKTLADFLFDSMRYQIEKGSLTKKQ